MPHSHSADSLRTLLGIVSLAAGVCSVVAMIYWTSPSEVGWSVFIAGIVLGVLIGFRSKGRRLDRALASIAFIFGAFLLALYASMVAVVWRTNDSGSDKAAMVAGFGVTMLAIFSPIMLMNIAMMIRAWTWSAQTPTPRCGLDGSDVRA
jgi:hypothetical protein